MLMRRWEKRLPANRKAGAFRGGRGLRYGGRRRVVDGFFVRGREFGHRGEGWSRNLRVVIIVDRRSGMGNSRTLLPLPCSGGLHRIESWERRGSSRVGRVGEL